MDRSLQKAIYTVQCTVSLAAVANVRQTQLSKNRMALAGTIFPLGRSNASVLLRKMESRTRKRRIRFKASPPSVYQDSITCMIVGFHYETAPETIRKHRKKIRSIFLPIGMSIILQDYKASNTNDKQSWQGRRASFT